MPEADVVVHSGDFCMVGSEQKLLIFLTGSATFRVVTRFSSVATMTIAYMEQTQTSMGLTPLKNF
ncbi:hypothetical protein [uncultured Muribaculum sp.]|uniref:hypothetical protein n=1 Tax=uncultured Muribaculum sp. TaxID=1918613 RepID=UPI0025B7642C|nr:hypothetical protein [uncultured Muribaculum sp.]